MALFRRKNRSSGPARPRPGQVGDDTVIDLRDQVRAPGELVWGMPTRCPECGDFGYLDTVDVERGVMHQHCPSCWAKWDITLEQIEAQNGTVS